MSMLDKSISKVGTLVIKGGEVFVGEDWEVPDAMCREVAILACLWGAQHLMEQARAAIQKPGGGLSCIGMPDGWPGGWQEPTPGRDAEDAARFRFLMDPDNADRFPRMWEKLSYKCYGETQMREAIDTAMQEAAHG